MEMVRRRKMCRNTMRLQPKNKLIKENKENKIDEKENNSGCSNDLRKNHPYEGDINFVHVLSDVLYDTHLLACNLFTHLSDSNDFVPTAENFYQRLDAAVDVMRKTFREVYYAENNDIVLKSSNESEPHRILMMQKKKPKEVVPCRGYKCNLYELVDEATKCLLVSTSKSEKRVHRNKRLVFEALRKAAKCNPHNPDWMF